MLSATSTPWAAWYVIPADRKWFARLCAGAVLAHTLIKLGPQYPAVSQDARLQLQAARRELEAEAPEGTPADPFTAKQQANADAGRRRRRGRDTLGPHAVQSG
jgi:hypothetical protein